MSSSVPGDEWRARTLRAWQLAILRFAVTLDNADRLAIMAIAREIDRLGPERDGKPRILAFFAAPVRSFAPPFCSRMNLRPRCCINTLRELTMVASSAPSQEPLKPTKRRHLRSPSLSGAIADCGE